MGEHNNNDNGNDNDNKLTTHPLALQDNKLPASEGLDFVSIHELGCLIGCGNKVAFSLDC